MSDTVVARSRASKVSWRIVDRMIIVESTIIVIRIIVIQVPCQIAVSACKAQHTHTFLGNLGVLLPNLGFLGHRGSFGVSWKLTKVGRGSPSQLL